MVRNGEVGRLIQNNNDGSRVDSQYDSDGRLRTQEDVFTNGTSAIKYLDTRNTHPYSRTRNYRRQSPAQIIAAKPKIDGQPSNGNAVDFSAVGQVLGSALGRALAPDNQFGQSRVGTVAGAVGQKLAQAFSVSLLTDASQGRPRQRVRQFPHQHRRRGGGLRRLVPGRRARPRSWA